MCGFVVVQEHDLAFARSPGLNRIHHLCDEAECRPQTGSYRPTSVADLNNALVAEWEKIPAARFQKSCYQSK